MQTLHAASSMPLDSMSAMDNAADHIPGARLEIFEDSDHAPFYSEAEKFNRVVTEFVNNPLRGLLLEGAASDPSGPADGAFFAELRERVRGRAKGSAETRS